MPQRTVVVEYAGLLLTLRGDYTPERRGQPAQFGDGGEPDEPAEFEINEACLADGTSLIDLLDGAYLKHSGNGIAAYIPLLTHLENLALELLR